MLCIQVHHVFNLLDAVSKNAMRDWHSDRLGMYCIRFAGVHTPLP